MDNPYHPHYNPSIGHGQIPAAVPLGLSHIGSGAGCHCKHPRWPYDSTRSSGTRWNRRGSGTVQFMYYKCTLFMRAAALAVRLRSLESGMAKRWRNYTNLPDAQLHAIYDAVRPVRPGRSAAGKEVTFYQPGPFGGNAPRDGTVTLEGPHYPAPHSWYARALVKDGLVVKVIG